MLYSLRARGEVPRVEWVLKELFPGASLSFEEVAGRVALIILERG